MPITANSRAQAIRRLAFALAAGPLDDPVAATARVLPLIEVTRAPAWLAAVVLQVTREFGAAPRPGWRTIADRIGNHPSFVKAWIARKVHVSPATAEPVMAPAEGAPESWALPEIPDLAELSCLLRVHPDDLRWVTWPAREHYGYQWREKAKTGRFRLLETPKPLLKSAQRRVLRSILDAVPPHEAATGFRRGTSVRDFVTPHTGRRVVIRCDIADFFPSITSARVRRVFLTAGYPEQVADALTRLTTHAADPVVLREKPLAFGERSRLAASHLPQGAPTSPALANLCAFRLDCRLAGLARACDASYTRYADDLLFSGGEDLRRSATRFLATVGGIALEEGFHLQHRKTRVMPDATCQHAAGVVLNSLPNLDRRDYDRLKAILTNCVRHGPATQNHQGHPDFAAHLSGRISWVRFLNPAKGGKLEEIFRRIEWPGPEL